MLPTVLMRWSWCYSYFVWLYGFYYGGCMLSLALLFVLVFFSPFSIGITPFGKERAGLCVSSAFVCLFCTRWFLSFFSSSLCRGLATACDCGSYDISGIVIISLRKKELVTLLAIYLYMYELHRMPRFFFFYFSALPLCVGVIMWSLIVALIWRSFHSFLLLAPLSHV